MANIYISPSDQTENRYAYGNTNEHEQCQKIADSLAAALKRCGVNVMVAKLGSTMAQRCAESNNFKADLHVCVHTNAFNGKVSGTRLFCYSIPGKGYYACKAIYNRLAPITPGTSENVTVNSRLFEVREPAAPTAYCECEFHDNPTSAKWIVEHVKDIGEAIAHGICDYLSVPYKSVPVPPPPQPTPAKSKLYRVQVGAFRDKGNADRYVAKLKEMGLSAFIVEVET